MYDNLRGILSVLRRYRMPSQDEESLPDLIIEMVPKNKYHLSSSDYTALEEHIKDLIRKRKEEEGRAVELTFSQLPSTNGEENMSNDAAPPLEQVRRQEQSLDPSEISLVYEESPGSPLLQTKLSRYQQVQPIPESPGSPGTAQQTRRRTKKIKKKQPLRRRAGKMKKTVSKATQTTNVYVLDIIDGIQCFDITQLQRSGV